jgi:hypothetical protein
MSARAAITLRSYAIDGVRLTVRSHDPAVLEAMDLRLRGFDRDPSPARAEVRFEFVAGGESAAPPAGRGRPVYDTPYGSVYYFPDADAIWGELAGVHLRCEPGRGIAWVQSAVFTGRELYLATHPLATIGLMELLERHGLFSLHAACLATSVEHGVLVAGPSGAGKSTLALALARAGMSFLSDDVVFLARDGDGAMGVIGFADAIGLTEHTAERFSELRRLLDDPAAPGFPKRLRRIEELFGAPVLTACVPEVLVFPQVRRGQPSRIAPLDPQEALLRLVPDVLLTEPAATQAHLAAIAAMLGQVRCYAVDSGVDLERAAELVHELV